jgi:hypothetical protein
MKQEETMRNIILQELNEQRFNRKHIDVKIRTEIEASPVMVAKVEQGVELVDAYIKGKYYDSKMSRVAQLVGMDIPAIVMDLFIGIAYSLKPDLFTSVSAQMASRLKFNDQTAAITTTAELMAVLCQTDAFDITKENKMASLMVVSCIPLSPVLTRFIENSQFLPPMVCEPLPLTHNYSSGYLTHNDSLILGSGNHHDGDICLDTLNTMNQVALQLDTDFLRKVEEEPTFELDSQDKVDQWKRFKKQSTEFYVLMAEQGNQFYLCHKVDKRGRAYAHGYHISSQGTAFKKAILEFTSEELVEGVPTT